MAAESADNATGEHLHPLEKNGRRAPVSKVQAWRMPPPVDDGDDFLIQVTPDGEHVFGFAMTLRQARDFFAHGLLKATNRMEAAEA